MAEHDPDPRRLLAKAIQQLDQDDREQVTTWLLGRSFEAAGRGGVGLTLLRQTRDRFLGSLDDTVPRGGYQVVPIRLPAVQHAALRDWCAAHNFSMATVVRGLVERFLEEHGHDPARAG